VWSRKPILSSSFIKKKNYFNPKIIAVHTTRFFQATYLNGVRLSRKQMLDISDQLASELTPLSLT
jgi:hypothetical protein